SAAAERGSNQVDGVGDLRQRPADCKCHGGVFSVDEVGNLEGRLLIEVRGGGVRLLSAQPAEAVRGIFSGFQSGATHLAAFEIVAQLSRRAGRGAADAPAKIVRRLSKLRPLRREIWAVHP